MHPPAARRFFGRCTIVVGLLAISPSRTADHAVAGGPSSADRGVAATAAILESDDTSFTVRFEAPEPATCSEPAWPIGLVDPAAVRVEILAAHRRILDVPGACVPKASSPNLVAEVDGSVVAMPPRGEPSADHRATSGAGAPGPYTCDGKSVVRVEPLGTLRGTPIARLVYCPIARLGHNLVETRSPVVVRVTVASSSSAEERLGGLAWADRALEPPDSPFGAIADAALLNAKPLRLQQLANVRTGRRGPSQRERPPLGSRSGACEGAPYADASALKLYVSAEGPLAVSGAELAEAGWAIADIDPKAVSMWSNGSAHAVDVREGGDDRLDLHDVIVFHGTPMEGEFTRGNVYWLLPNGNGPRFGTRNAGSLHDTTPITRHAQVQRLEEDTTYLMSIQARQGVDRWVWGDRLYAGDGRAVAFVAHDPSPNARPAQLRLRLQGYASDPSYAPDHRMRLLLNDELVHHATFDGRTGHTVEASSGDAPITNGTNELTIESLDVPGGGATNQFYLDWAELGYVADLRARDNRLMFTASGSPRPAYTITGFDREDLVVDDVTDPAAPIRIDGPRTAPGANGGFSLRFADVTGPGARYAVYAPSQLPPVDRIVPNLPSCWHDLLPGADHVIFAHGSLADAVRPLADFHAQHGLRSAVVRIDDVYDEFSHGVFDPRAIRAFLRHAVEHWPVRPAFALLVGESNLDYRGGYGIGPPNLVPSMQVDLSSGAAGPSDAWFASLDDDFVPDVMLGRISASTPAEAGVAVDKVIRYETLSALGRQRMRAVFVADDDAAFEDVTDDLIRETDTVLEPTRLYASRMSNSDDLPTAINAAVDPGAFLLSYVGHGNVDRWGTWAGGRIYDNRDIRRLSNSPSLPVLASAACMNGWVSHPFRPVAMAELWLTHDSGGGPAAWASAGIEPLTNGSVLMQGLLESLVQRDGLPIGGHALLAQLYALTRVPGSADAVRQQVLLGDPALIVRTTSRGAIRSVCFLPRVGRAPRHDRQ